MSTLLHAVLLFVLTSVSPSILSPVSTDYHPAAEEKMLISDSAVTVITAKMEREMPSPSPRPSAQLIDHVLSIVSDYPETNISVVIRSLHSGENISIQGNDPVTAASTAKLLTALMYLDRAEQTGAGLDTKLGSYPVRDQLEQLIRQSNNDAWELFISSVGFSKHNRYAENIGMRAYEAKDNTMSAEDMAVLLTHIYQRDLVSEKHSALLLSFMQDTNEERFIPPAVPVGINVYHKTGILDGFVHDGGIIDDGKNPFIVVIFTENPSFDYDERTIIFRRITRVAIQSLMPYSNG